MFKSMQYVHLCMAGKREKWEEDASGLCARGSLDFYLVTPGAAGSEKVLG